MNTQTDRHYLLIAAFFACCATACAADSTTSIYCSGHTHNTKKKWDIQKGQRIFTKCFFKLGATERAIYPDRNPVDWGKIGSNRQAQFRVVAHDKDDHVCQPPELPVFNKLKPASIAVDVYKNAVNSVNFIDKAALTPSTSGDDNVWTGTWTIPEDLAGGVLIFVFRGTIDDVTCNDHRNSSDDDSVELTTTSYKTAVKVNSGPEAYDPPRGAFRFRPPSNVVVQGAAGSARQYCLPYGKADISVISTSLIDLDLDAAGNVVQDHFTMANPVKWTCFAGQVRPEFGDSSVRYTWQAPGPQFEEDRIVLNLNDDGSPAEDGGHQPAGSQRVYIVRLVSAEIVNAPADGLVVKKGDTFTCKATILPNHFIPRPNQPTWATRQLKANGTWEPWMIIGGAYGALCPVTTTKSGIFRLSADLGVGGLSTEAIYLRQQDDAHSTLLKGTPDCFGVADKPVQVTLVGKARLCLGGTYYSASGSLPSGVDPFGLFTGRNKCNVFVADMCDKVGANVGQPVNGTYTGAPPSANTWAGMPDPNDPQAPHPIPDWTLLPDDSYPQPGHVVASGFATGASGHCGILDYDGQWISAGPNNVNRKADLADPHYWRYFGPGVSKPSGKRQYSK